MTLLSIRAPSAQAAVSIELALEQLATRSSAVVVGTPVESRSLWEEGEGRRRIVTYHRVTIEKVVAGKLEGTETWVRTLGGSVGTIGQRVEGEAVLPAGKRMLLFVTSRPEGGVKVVGMAQGVWMLVRGEDGVDRVQPGLQRGLLVPNKAKRSARLELAGRSLDEASARVVAARANHAP